MNRQNIGSGGNPATDGPRKSTGLAVSRPWMIIAGVALFLMFTGFLITTTVLVANNQSTKQAEILTAKVRAARPKVAIAAPTVAPDTTAEVTRNISGITNGAELATTGTLARNELNDANQKSFDAVVQEASIAALQVNEMERAYALPSCVAELQELMETVRIGFDTGSSQPRFQDMNGARRIASTLVGCDPVMVAVEGHSDLTGEEQNNMALSWIRADAVISRLAAEGFDVKGFEPLGFGARKPIDRATTPEANDLNRRVQFHLAPRPGTDAALFAEN